MSNSKHKYIILFTDRNFLPFWISFFLFGMGTGLFTISLNWWVLLETNSEMQLGLVNTFALIPMFIFCLFSGIIADNFDRKKIVIFALVFRGFIFYCYLILNFFQILNIGTVYILAFFQGLSFPFYLNAVNAIMPEVIEKENLLSANALVDSAMWSASIIGFFSGGFLIVSFGIMNLFMISAFITIGAGLLFFLIKYSFEKPLKKISLFSFFSDIKSGVSILKNDSVLLIFILTWSGIFILFGNGPMSIGWPVFSKSILNTGSGGYGLLVAMYSLSSLIGSLVIGHWGANVKKGKLTLIGYIWGSIGIIIFSFTTDLLFASIVLFFWSFYFPLINVAYWTALQERVHHEELGKITGVAFTLTSALGPISTMMTGYLMEFVSITLPFLLFGVAFIICFILIYLSKETRILR
ncbi:MAG: MFS transporter [Promethearchaeota archaeon]